MVNLRAMYPLAVIDSSGWYKWGKARCDLQENAHVEYQKS